MIIKMFTFDISLFPWRIETGIKRFIDFIEIEFDSKVSIDFRLGGVECHMNYVCVFCLTIVQVCIILLLYHMTYIYTFRTTYMISCIYIYIYMYIYIVRVKAATQLPRIRDDVVVDVAKRSTPETSASQELAWRHAQRGVAR